MEKLNFYWFEEPMDESSMSSYKWLSDQLDIPVIGPETMTGKISTRAEWIKNDVVDILRGGVGLYKSLILEDAPPGAVSPILGLVTLAVFFISIQEN